MLHRCIAAPAAEPVTLAEARAHLRVDGTADDALIALFLAAAREAVEQETGRSLMPTDWELRLDNFPDGPIILPTAPVIQVDWLRTVDAAGAVTTLAAAAYQVARSEGPVAQRTLLWPAAFTTWPTTVDGLSQSVRVAYRAGYVSAAEVPAALRAAILLALGSLYANREAEAAAKMERNPAFDRLIAPYRLFWG